MFEKAVDRRRRVAKRPPPARIRKPSGASADAGPKPSEQTPVRTPVWIESGARAHFRCALRPRSSARTVHVMMKAPRDFVAERFEAESASAPRVSVAPSGKANASNDKVDGSASVRRNKDLDRVLQLVSRHFDVPVQFLLHHSRCQAPIARARQVAMYLMNTSLSRTMTEIGACFDRDRTTVAYACARVEDRRDDEQFDEEMAALETEISAIDPVAGEKVRFHG